MVRAGRVAAAHAAHVSSAYHVAVDACWAFVTVVKADADISPRFTALQQDMIDRYPGGAMAQERGDRKGNLHPQCARAHTTATTPQPAALPACSSLRSR